MVPSPGDAAVGRFRWKVAGEETFLCCLLLAIPTVPGRQLCLLHSWASGTRMLGSREAAGYSALGSWGCLPPTQSTLLNQSQPVPGILLESFPHHLRETDPGPLRPLLGTLAGLQK